MCPFKTSFLQWTTFVMWYRCCHAARLIKARRIFVAVLIDNEPSCPRACNIKTEAVFANWLAPKHGALFTLGHSAYITFRIIMSFRKPCHMPFRNFIPPFTFTEKFFIFSGEDIQQTNFKTHQGNFSNCMIEFFRANCSNFTCDVKKKLYNSLSVYVLKNLILHR